VSYYGQQNVSQVWQNSPSMYRVYHSEALLPFIDRTYLRIGLGYRQLNLCHSESFHEVANFAECQLSIPYASAKLLHPIDPSSKDETILREQRISLFSSVVRRCVADWRWWVTGKANITLPRDVFQWSGEQAEPKSSGFKLLPPFLKVGVKDRLNHQDACFLDPCHALLVGGSN
jgi:hypothetical protein